LRIGLFMEHVFHEAIIWYLYFTNHFTVIYQLLHLTRETCIESWNYELRWLLVSNGPPLFMLAKTKLMNFCQECLSNNWTTTSAATKFFRFTNYCREISNLWHDRSFFVSSKPHFFCFLFQNNNNNHHIMTITGQILSETVWININALLKENIVVVVVSVVVENRWKL